MSSFVLVHGSFHGGWCWEKIVPRLEAAGHRARAIDLPGRAGDGLAAGALGLDDYVARLADAIAAEREPVVLVGHSMGGVLITAAAERMPERIARLVYVCAFLPANGESLIAIAKTDSESALLRHLVFDEGAGTHHVTRDGARAAFYHDCSDEDAARAIERLVPESLPLVATPIASSAGRFGRVPRTYVECTDDRALGPATQRRMHAAQPCRVIALASSHSPFYSQPDALARALVA